MNILVTGGAGFIASHIVDAYLEAGHKVCVVDNLSTGRKENLNAGAQFIEIDICDPAIEEIFAANNFDTVNHHAAQMDVRKSVEDPAYDARNNVLGIINLLQNCARFSVSKFIFSSTGGAVYGEQQQFPADEEHPNWPVSPYGISKLSGEKYIHYYFHNYGMQYVVLRYANVYGPRQNPFGEAGVVAIFSTRLLTGQKAVIYGDGIQTRDYVYVGDVVRANVLALGYLDNGCFNIGTSIETDVNVLFAKINELTHAAQEEIHEPPKEGEQMRSVLSYERAKGQLGWQPEISLDEGLHKTVEWFRDFVSASDPKKR